MPGTTPCPLRLWPVRRRRPRLASTRDRHPARGAPRRPQSGPARGGAPRRRAAARRRRRGVGQDPRPHAPGRSPDPRARREAERDPRDHLHQQGRDRDAGAARAHPRSHGPRDLDPHVPRRLRADPPPRGRAARLPLVVHDLRPGRPGAGRQGVPRGARQGPEALHPARDPRADLEREEPARLTRGVHGTGCVVLGPDGRRGVRALPAQAPCLERRRLRRHADAHRRRARALPRGARALAELLPPRPRRRVPGHEQGPVPPPAAARGEAPERVRGGRSGPVDLRFPRRRHPQHPRLRGGLRWGGHDRARAELPLDELDPRSGERGHRQQPRPEAETPVVGARRRRPRGGRRGRGRARGGTLRRGGDRPSRRVRLLRSRDRGLLPDERPVARPRGRARPPGRAVPGDRRASVLRARRDQGRCRLPLAAEQLRRRGRAHADRE